MQQARISSPPQSLSLLYSSRTSPSVWGRDEGLVPLARLPVRWALINSRSAGPGWRLLPGEAGPAKPPRGKGEGRAGAAAPWPLPATWAGISARSRYRGRRLPPPLLSSPFPRPAAAARRAAGPGARRGSAGAFPGLSLRGARSPPPQQPPPGAWNAGGAGGYTQPGLGELQGGKARPGPSAIVAHWPAAVLPRGEQAFLLSSSSHRLFSST